MHKVDFHTHSVASPDGDISAQQYKQLLTSGKLHTIAVTDHNRIDFAQQLQHELGDQIIVGEEITAQEGEIVGLFLRQVVPAGLTALETVQAIKSQNGLVYIPHPFEIVRKGLQLEILSKIADYIDIVEVHNGRAMFRNRSLAAMAWASNHQKLAAASSDAHGLKGVGYTYTQTPGEFTAQTLPEQLIKATLVFGRPPLRTLLYPKTNRLLKRLRKRRV